MSNRPKRRPIPPKKFSIDEGPLFSLSTIFHHKNINTGYTLPDSPERTQQQNVLRYLNLNDLNRTLQDLTVYVLWPEDGLWYEAIIQKVEVVESNHNSGESTKQDHNAKLFYTDTSEEEMVDLQELISDRHIAFLETRSIGEELKEDELSADGRIHAAQSQSASEAHPSDEESSHDEGNPSNEPIETSNSAPEFVHSKQEDNAYYGLDYLTPQGSGLLSQRRQSEGSSVDFVPRSLSGDAMKRRRQLIALKRQSSTGSRDYYPPLNLNRMTKLREKTIEQLNAVLKKGLSECSQEPSSDFIPSKSPPDAEVIHRLSKAIEVEMMKLYGGENAEYTNKFRTLFFNLKDSRNHELRQRVLSGEISPEKLVAMSPKDLAPQELNQWRQKKKEEFLEATVLDEGAAAKFSTAAALKQSEVLRQQRLKAELSEAAPIVVEPVGQTQLEPVQDTAMETENAEEQHVEEDETTEPPMRSVEPETVDKQIEIEMEDGIDIGEIPDWALEVVEAPPSAVRTSALYSPKAEERNNSAFGPVPIRTTPLDLTPLLMKDDGSLVVGETVWKGEIGCPDRAPFKAQCIAIAGKCNLQNVLTAPLILVQGRMQLKKVEDFLEKLRTSKSRTVTLSIIRPPSDATDDDIAAIQDSVHYYLSRERTGAMTLSEDIEGYLIAKCSLTGRLLSAARSLMQNEKIPKDIDVNEFLLVVVHRKDWVPKSQESAVAAETPMDVTSMDPSDPRPRRGIKPAFQRPPKEESRPVLPSGLTLESISNLAAMFGVTKSQPAPSEPPPSQPALPPHQMSVPTDGVSASVKMSQPQSNVSIHPEPPKFLIFDPSTNNAVPLNPASVQYDSASNRVILVGPLPHGFAVQRLTTSEDSIPTSDRFMTETQTNLPLKTSQGDSVTEASLMNENPGFMTFVGTSIPPIVSNVMQRFPTPMVASMPLSSGYDFRRDHGRSGGFSHPSVQQSFPEGGNPL